MAVSKNMGISMYFATPPIHGILIVKLMLKAEDLWVWGSFPKILSENWKAMDIAGQI
jgi:hypothetical protein